MTMPLVRKQEEKKQGKPPVQTERMRPEVFLVSSTYKVHDFTH